jgi:hypothetical protein
MTKIKLCFQILFTIVIFTMILNRGYSQVDYNKSFEFNLTNLPFQDFTFIFTKKLNENKYLEISNSIVLHKVKEEYMSVNPVFTIQDPYQLHDMYKFRIGIRKFTGNSDYQSAMLVLNLGHFNDCLIVDYIGKNDGSHSIDYLLNRTKLELGIIYKYGTFERYGKNYFGSFYSGIGFKVKFFYDTVLARYSQHYYFDNNSSFVEYRIKFLPTIHFGFLFGYTK